MITSQQINAIFQLYPQIVKFVDDTAYDADGNEVAYDLSAVTTQAQKDACKAQAKALLASSDWSSLADVDLVNKADFVAYRAILRGLVINPADNPVFPTEPTPIWS